ncbi:MAG TPA: head GIN domain-containing protein, partial [Pyrinomonadaceae bacterium]|nr:head GIN domain-containing protein [Pyrinomonadaceae bacterium]
IAAQRDFNVEVEADDNLLQNIKTEVRGDTLKIYTEGSISTRNPIRVRIAMPQIESFDISGASTGTLTNVKNETLQIDASGASKIKVDGEVRELIADLSGASRLDSENLRTENVNIEASGASNATVFASNEINAEASGASSIRYTGAAKTVRQDSSGASSIKQK